MRRFFYYVGWTIVFGFIIYTGDKYQYSLKEDYMKNLNAMSFVLFSTIFPVVIGILLRLPKLLNEIRENRQWTFDWAKFIGIGLPTLCIISMYVLIFYVPESILPFIPQEIFLGNSTVQTIAGVVFGFVLLDSVKK